MKLNPHISSLKLPELERQQADLLDDMVDLFSGIRAGHIARHGYVGSGSGYYSRWLAEHPTYHHDVTLTEQSMIERFTPDLTKMFGVTSNFIELGIGSITAFNNKTRNLLSAISNHQLVAPTYTIVDINQKFYEVARDYIKAQGLPYAPRFICNNIFDELPAQKKDTAIWCSGLTFTNIPSDTTVLSSQDILTHTLTRFARALKNGGTLAFTYSAETKGEEVKKVYDHPLLHAYQLSIFQRVADELPVSGNYEPKAFGNIQHRWNELEQVLTRHVCLNKDLNFTLGGYNFDLQAGQEFYIANNFRFRDALIRQASKQAGFNVVKIMAQPNSALRIAVMTTL